MPAPKPPKGIGSAGSALWSGIAGKYELRADESRVLLDACALADVVATLEAAMVGQDLMIKGSMGQMILNPLLSEQKTHRTALASLLRQLKLPDDASSDQGGELSAKNRTAANARWTKRGA